MERLWPTLRVAAALLAVLAVASAVAVVSVGGSTATADRVLGERYGGDVVSVQLGDGPPTPADKVPYSVAIQKVLTRSGDPTLVANFRPDGALATARWWICPPPDTTVCVRTRHRLSLTPGRSRAGTIFQAVARFHRKRYVARTPAWRGTVRATARPSVAGDARVGGTVRPLPGRWRGGWPGDYAFQRIEACRTADARRCVTVVDTDRMHPGPHRRVVVPAAYAGRYLFAFDQRFAHDTAFGEPGYRSPRDLPPLRTGRTVVRSTRGVLVSG